MDNFFTFNKQLFKYYRFNLAKLLTIAFVLDFFLVIFELRSNVFWTLHFSLLYCVLCLFFGSRSIS